MPTLTMLAYLSFHLRKMKFFNTDVGWLGGIKAEAAYVGMGILFKLYHLFQYGKVIFLKHKM